MAGVIAGLLHCVGAASWAAPAEAPSFTNAAVFFIWYDSRIAEGNINWVQSGVAETPLIGYYDSVDQRTAEYEVGLTGEWGIDLIALCYWGRDIRKQHIGLDSTVQAAAKLGRMGRPPRLTFYMDGNTIDYKDLQANAEDDSELLYVLREYYLPHRDLWYHANGKPFLFVYGRNGTPARSYPSRLSVFREQLRQRYGDVEALNRRWGTSYAALEAVEPDPASPVFELRAMSAQLPAATWAHEFEELSRKVGEKLGIPGVVFAVDWPWRPLGNSYSGLAHAFGGHHTYWWEFGQELNRFIFSEASKAEGAGFFDNAVTRQNLMNTPWGLSYVYGPEPRLLEKHFIAGTLLNRSTGILSPSWNEWWEGSNIEPSLEYGREWVERTELLGAVSRQCAPVFQRERERASLGVVLNEYAALAGRAPCPEDLMACLASVRRLGIPFRLLTEGSLSPDALDELTTIIAPSCGAHFGFASDGRAIDALLRDWVQTGEGRRLVLTETDDEEWFRLLGLRREGQPQMRLPKTVVCDFGPEGDAPYLGAGWRDWGEDWSHFLKPADCPRGDVTVRWCTAEESTISLPVRPHTRLELEVAVRFMQPLQTAVLFNGHELGVMEGSSESVARTFSVTPEMVGDGTVARVTLRHDHTWVPSAIDPTSTDDEPKASAVHYIRATSLGDFPEQPRPRVVTLADGGQVAVAHAGALWQMGPEAAVVARDGEGIAKLLRVAVGQNEVLYDNGYLTAEGDGYLRRLLSETAMPPSCASDTLLARGIRLDDTWIVAAYRQPKAVGTEALDMRLPAEGKPLSEAQLLTEDRRTWGSVALEGGKMARAIAAHGLYQVTFSPLQLDTERPHLVGGTRDTLRVRLSNLGRVPLVGTLTVSGSPSLTAEATRFRVPAGGVAEVAVPVRLSRMLDAGNRTLVFVADYGSGRATFFRPATAVLAPEREKALPRYWPLVSRAHRPSRPDRTAEMGVVSHDLGTGRGEVMVRTPWATWTFSEAAGGGVTAIEMVPDGFRHEGRLSDAGIAAGGAARWQSEAPGVLQVAERGGEEVVVAATAAAAGAHFAQTWRFRRGCPAAEASFQVEAARAGEVIPLRMALDARDVTKIIPCGTGQQQLEGPLVHYGAKSVGPRVIDFVDTARGLVHWEVPAGTGYLTDFVSFQNWGDTVGGFVHALSLVIRRVDGVEGWTQGVYPEEGLKVAGPPRWATCEFYGRGKRAVVEVTILPHYRDFDEFDVLRRGTPAHRLGGPLFTTGPALCWAPGGGEQPLRLVETNDGNWTEEEREGVPCVVTGRDTQGPGPYDNDHYLYLDIRDAGVPRAESLRASFTIRYLDAGTDTFRVEYDGPGDSIPESFRPTVPIRKRDTREWQTATLYAGRVEFAGQQHFGADFRVSDNLDGPEAVAAVEVRIAAER